MSLRKHFPTASQLVPALLVLLFSPFVVNAQSDGQRITIATLTTEHRPPAMLRSDIENLLRPGDDLGIIGEHFIVTTSRNNLVLVREALEQLDTPLRQLRLRVLFDPETFQDDDSPDLAESDADIVSAEPDWQQYLTREGDALLIREPAGDDEAGDPLVLRLQADLRDDALQVDYGFRSGPDGEPRLEHREILTPGQWHRLVLEAEPVNTEETDDEEAPSAAPPASREIEIRIDILD